VFDLSDGAKLLVKQANHGRRQHAIDGRAPLCDLADTDAAPLRQHHAELVQETAHRVDRRSTNAPPMCACTVQREHRLLLYGLDRHPADVSMSRCMPDRASVGRIVLVANDKWPDLARRQHLRFVAEPAQRSGPVMRTTPCFHGYLGQQQAGEKFNELGARQFAAMDLARRSVDPVQLHHVLGRMNGLRRNIHLGPPASVVV
jgi:hypothetical protein